MHVLNVYYDYYFAICGSSVKSVVDDVCWKDIHNWWCFFCIGICAFL